MITASIETKNYSHALRVFRRYWKINQEEALKTQARLLAVKLVQFTPPRTQAQGEGAVESDMARLFAKGYEGKDGGRFFYGDDGARYSLPRNHYGRVDARRRQDGAYLFAPVFNNTHLQTVKELGALHYRFRGANGRVNRVKQRSVADPDTLDNLKVQRMWNVGQAKGGWLPAVVKWPVNTKYAGGRNRVDARPWIRRHMDKGEARYVWHPHFPAVEMTNKSEWAKKARNAWRVVRNAMNSQAKHMLKSVRVAANDAAQHARLSKGIYRITT